jgi:4-diphosphocytidyl-2C-methyl-D-erythritol kinase
LTASDWSSKINEFQAFVRVLASWHSARAACPFSANDFEAIVFRQFPQLKTIERKLSKLGAVRMTGSGSTIFAIFGSRRERDRAEAVLKGKYLVMAASLVGREAYRRLWRRQLNEHLGGDKSLWPLQSRYAK